MSEFIIVATRENSIASIRCNREGTANLIIDYLRESGWDATWFRDAPLIGQRS